MTLRLRLTCDGQVREYVFDRPRISLGRGPANDLVIPSPHAAPQLGALVVDDAGISLQLQALVEVVRDGALIDQDHDAATLSLAVGDVLCFGGGEGQLEVVAWAGRARGAWVMRPLKGAPLPVDAALASALADAPGDLEVLLRALAASAQGSAKLALRRVALVIFTAAEEFLDDSFALDLSTQRFAMAADPLLRFGTDAEALRAQLEDVTQYTRAADAPAGESIYFGLRWGQSLGAMLCLERAGEAPAPLLEAWIRAVQPLVSLSLAVRQQARRAGALAEENRYFLERKRRRYLFKELVCESPAMQRTFARLNALVDQPPSPVLLLGEAGSGKELLVRALHHLGARRSGILISLHCGSLSEEELGFELFGCAEGALEGAQAARKGVFELAREGTVYLEEIDLLPSAMQAKLARLLREGEVRRIGESVGRRVSARLIASTHHDPRDMTQLGRLRHDLHLLLRDHALEVPPLRERREDILPLAKLFLLSFASRYGRQAQRLSDDLSARMLAHDWPGNVRELQTFVEVVVLKTPPEALEVPSEAARI